MARLKRGSLLVVSLVVTGGLLSACGSGGAVADAQQSCRYVHTSLALYDRSLVPTLDAGARTRLQARALSELLRATPAAAAATSIDGSWNPLMTTINEAERVSLQELIPALRRLCSVADSATPYL